MSSTCFEPKSSFFRKMINTRIYSYGTVRCTCISISSPVGRIVCSSTCKAAYTDACTAYHIITVYTTVFLKMNHLVRNI